MKKTNIPFFFIYITLSSFTLLYASNLTFEGIKERKFSKKNLEYILQAQKKIVADSIYYENGTLFQKDLQVDFKRAYFFEGNLYMQECSVENEKLKIEAKSAVYKKEYIDFTDLILKIKDKTYHKFKCRATLN